MSKNYLDKAGLIRVKDKIVALITSSLSGKEDKSNKVTSISASSTDTEYPSAKAVHTLVNNNKTTITIREW